MSEIGPGRRLALRLVLLVGVVSLVATIATMTVAEDEETIGTIEVNLTEGVDPYWVPAGRLTEVNATVFGSRGTDLTNGSEILWDLSSDLVSWMPLAPNVINIYPEWSTEMYVNITATWSGRSISTSVLLRTVRSVEDARLVMDPMAPVCYGDTVQFSVLLLDWRDVPILEGFEFNWSVTTGPLIATEEPNSMYWTLNEVGLQTIAVDYLQGPIRGSATYTVEVLPRLISIEVLAMPPETELGTTLLMPVTVQDHEQNDVTKQTDISIAVTEGCVTAIRWGWDQAAGYLQVKAVRPGKVTFDVVADLHGSTIRTNHTLFISGTLEEPVLKPGNDLFDKWFDTVMVVLMVCVAILGVAGVFSEWAKLRSIPEGEEDEGIEGEEDEDLVVDESLK